MTPPAVSASWSIDPAIFNPDTYLTEQLKLDLEQVPSAIALCERNGVKSKKLKHFLETGARASFAQLNRAKIGGYADHEYAQWYRYFRRREDYEDSSGYWKVPLAVDVDYLASVRRHFGAPQDVLDALPLLRRAFRDVRIVRINGNNDDVMIFGRYSGSPQWAPVCRWGTGNVRVPETLEEVDIILKGREVMPRRALRSVGSLTLIFAAVPLFFYDSLAKPLDVLEQHVAAIPGLPGATFVSEFYAASPMFTWVIVAALLGASIALGIRAVRVARLARHRNWFRRRHAEFLWAM